jgi:DNA-binding NarL/FixJ family response regulator
MRQYLHSVDGRADMENRTTVVVCESEPVAIAGLRSYLDDKKDFALIGHAGSISAVLVLVSELRPDVLLLDHSSSIRSTLHFLSELRALSEATPCLLWTRDVPDVDLVRAFRAGAKGYVRKASPLSVLHDALRAVARGETYLEETSSASLRQWTHRAGAPRLTPREREIIELVLQGLKNREIAERLSITPGTVKVHLMHVFEKANVRDRYELAVRGRRLLLEGAVASVDVRKSA